MDSSKAMFLASHLTEKSNVATMLSRRYEQLLRTEKFYDCVFRVGAVHVRCHKLILSAASPVFEAMFYGPIQEQQMEIDIVDMSAEVFQYIITYIYTGVVPYEALSLEDTIELYYGAEKYMLVDLTADCLAAIARKLRFSNIMPALELSVCLDLKDLMNVCMSFFTRCCLGDPQFVSYLKSHYEHVSKECIKGIIAANPASQKQLLWFVNEWCQRECNELGQQRNEAALLIDDLQLKDDDGNATVCEKTLSKRQQSCSVERSYFKACRPFVIDADIHEWRMSLQCDRFISLLGVSMPSRFTPSHSLGSAATMHFLQTSSLPQDYTENLSLEISTVAGPPSDGEEDEEETVHAEAAVIWCHTISQRATKYNCDLNIRWDEGVILSPDVEYMLTIKWQPQQAYGAEYPCSLLSDTVNGIRFRDYNPQSGSLVKGVHFLNLV